MKLIHLSIKNITSFKGIHEIDFAFLNEENLFAITGQTGTGKSSILTAISLALYGKNYKKLEIEEKGKALHTALESIEKNSSTDFSAKSFQNKIDFYLENIKRWKKYEKDISDNAKNLNFESLFQAANNIFQNDYKDNKCPLCDTPIRQQAGSPKHVCVVTDPHLKTEQELKKLKKLTEWKNEKNQLEVDLKGFSFRDIRDEWQRIQQNLTYENWKEIGGGIEKPSFPDINFAKMESKLDNSPKLFFDSCESALNKDFSKLVELEKRISVYKEIKKKDNEIAKKITDVWNQGIKSVTFVFSTLSP